MNLSESVCHRNYASIWGREKSRCTGKHKKWSEDKSLISAHTYRTHTEHAVVYTTDCCVQEETSVCYFVNQVKSFECSVTSVQLCNSHNITHNMLQVNMNLREYSLYANNNTVLTSSLVTDKLTLYPVYNSSDSMFETLSYQLQSEQTVSPSHDTSSLNGTSDGDSDSNTHQYIYYANPEGEYNHVREVAVSQGVHLCECLCSSSFLNHSFSCISFFFTFHVSRPLYVTELPKIQLSSLSPSLTHTDRLMATHTHATLLASIHTWINRTDRIE